MKLSVKHIGLAQHRIKIKRGFDSVDTLRRINILYSERDLTIMLMILGNRHLANLAHFSPEKTIRSGTLKKK